MAREFSRTQRVGEQLQRELAQLIPQEVKDPRLGFVTVNAVTISRDLAYADVYVTVLGKEDSPEEIAASVKILNRAAGFLRGRIAQLIKLRIVPSLRFHYDSSVARGAKLSSLIEQAVSEDRQRQDGREDD
ncbi:30S ribosome-binding factor RbfA [Motiliproteus sediminis]|uniref:30S ribosome-binding factor RbfA n=1 Tax=Motiliproteus sediminis TaxID=1468178 RepID=UPI001AEFFA1C|nr:30S ribosome-binding factor RbfA [Motiliproteus sediminis]